jgi:hypothetical protein
MFMARCARRGFSLCRSLMGCGALWALLVAAPGRVVADPAPPENGSAQSAPPGGGGAWPLPKGKPAPTVSAPPGGGGGWPLPQGKPAPTVRAAAPDWSEAVAAYRRQQLIVEIEDVDGRPRGGKLGALIPPTVHARTFQGTPRVPLELEEFLSIVDRKDLVRLQRRWRQNRYVVAGVGSVTAATGIVLIALARTVFLRGDCVRDSFGNCIESDVLSRPGVAAAQWSGVGLTISGLLLSISSALLPRRLVSVERLNDLAVGYNRRLRERLGLPEEFSHRGPSFGLVPRVSTQGAGIDVVLVF